MKILEKYLTKFDVQNYKSNKGRHVISTLSYDTYQEDHCYGVLNLIF